jgi:uncharacterized protein YegL
MTKYSIGAINRSKWVLLALVFLIAQIIPIIQFNGVVNAADTGDPKTPSAVNSPDNWSPSNDATNISNISTSNDNYVSDDDGDEQGYTSFNLPTISAGSTINGIAVNIEAKSTANNGCRVGVALSWNNGSNYTSYKYVSLGTTDQSTLLGGSADNWGRNWMVTDFTNTSFVLKIQDNDPNTNNSTSGNNNCTNNATTSVDYLDVKVYYTEPTPPVTNPSLATSCGLDIALVIDNSSSVDNTELSAMKTALTSFTNALAGTPTQFSVTKFGTNATVLQNFTNNVTNVNSVINAVPNIPLTPTPNYTNWEDGLLKANSTFSSGTTNPDLVIFATDGDPTTSNTVGGIDTSQPNDHLDPAVVVANTIKTSGKRILAIGIGMSDSSLPRLEAISGPNDDTGDVLTSDVITSDFNTLATDLAEFASQTCGGTITTTKLIDADGNVNTTDDRTPAANWQFDIDGGSNPDATTTNAQGVTPAVKVTAGSGYSVNETQQQGYTLLDAKCTGATVNGAMAGNAVTGIQIATNNIVSCTFINARTNGTINVVKNLDNSDGGTKQKSDFSFTINGQTYQFEDDGTNTVTVPTGTYTVEEVNPNSAGYTTSYGNCTDVVVAETNSPACTIYNNDNAPSITLNKVVEGPTYGVNPDLNGFGLSVGGNTVTNGATTSVKANQAIALDEQGADGFEFVRIEGDQKCPSALGGTVTLDLEESISCTIVNKAIAPQLTIVKRAINDNGGTTTSEMFSLYANNTKLTNGLSNTVDAKTTKTEYTVNAQSGVTYELSEDMIDGYSASMWSCDGTGTFTQADDDIQPSIAVDLGETATCVIENNDEAPILTLLKSIKDDWNSGASIGDFTLKAENNSDASYYFEGTSGVTSSDAYSDTFQAGTYNLSESSAAHDTPSGAYASSWNCLYTNILGQTISITVAQVTLAIGESANCTVTNTFKPGTLVVTKDIVYPECEDCKSQYDYSDFSVDVINDATTAVVADDVAFSDNGVVQLELPTGSYSVIETNENTNGFSTTYENCSAISVSNGQVATCEVTNTKQSANLSIAKTDYALDDSTNPTVESITGKNQYYYIIAVTNTSDFSASGVTMTDTLPTSIKPLSVSSDDSNWNCDAPVGVYGETISCQYDSAFPAEFSSEIKLLVELQEGEVGNIVNSACVSQNYTTTKTCDDETTPIKSIAITAIAECRANFPYINWSVKPDNVTPTKITVQWFTTANNQNGDPEDTTQDEYKYEYILADATFSITPDPNISLYTFPDGTVISYNASENTYSATALWPGTTDDPLNPDWPGWKFENGVWLEDPTDLGGNLRPEAKVVVSVNPTSASTTVYPPATPLCDANPPRGSVMVYKYQDMNENGQWDETYFNNGPEPGLPGIEFKLTHFANDTSTEYFATTDADGYAVFTNIPQGSYYIEEIASDKWQVTQFECYEFIEQDTEEYNAAERQNMNADEFYLDIEGYVGCIVGNKSTVHKYNISKTNNVVTSKNIGDSITYTITLTIPTDSGILYSPRVGDAPPTGFLYITDSWTAMSSLRGDLKTAGISTQPTYASPGIWSFLGGAPEDNAFYPGEVITLTYQTKINAGVSPGTYPDVALSLAYASADVQNPETAILANVTNQDGATPFVGTEVTVVTDPVTPETLVNTGTSAIAALLFGSALVLAGIGTRRIVAKERRIN